AAAAVPLRPLESGWPHPGAEEPLGEGARHRLDVGEAPAADQGAEQRLLGAAPRDPAGRGGEEDGKPGEYRPEHAWVATEAAEEGHQAVPSAEGAVEVEGGDHPGHRGYPRRRRQTGRGRWRSADIT